MNFWERMQETLTPDRIYPLAGSLLRFILILAAGYVVTRIARRLIRGLRTRIVTAMQEAAGGTTTELDKRAGTLISIVGRTVTIVVWGIAVVMALKEVGFDVGPLLAGAGVAGLAVGFGAQESGAGRA